MLYYREDFDKAECPSSSCRADVRKGELYFHSACHPMAPTWAHLRGDVLTIECAKCKQKIVTLVIASRAQERHDWGDDERCP